MGTHKTMIKFKVWDTERKKFIKGWKELQKYFHSFCNDIKDKQQLGVSFWKEADGYFTICRYTGLKDKNGVRIYEGDIISLKITNKFSSDLSFDNKVLIVKYCWGAFRLFEENDEFSYVEDDGVLANYTEFKQMEVIGNIYENPELSEAKQGDNNSK